ncbi:MAG: hypothetical protein O7B26_02525, partial [Planctomycetota bacterium]|nr:hypothetical protein [Planctomycetota bacterium]
EPTPGLDHRYFGAPVIETDFGVDTASRIPNGQDTNTGENTGGGEDWTQQDNFTPDPSGTELFDANDRLSSPGTSNSADPLGLCCTVGICSEASVSACEPGGNWIGRISDCNDLNANPCLPLGACCVDATTCVIANQEACIVSLGGDYQGDNAVCDPLPCGPTGSCCEPDFNCTDDLTAEECAAVDLLATWTNGGTCLADCIAPEGACCVSDVCDDMPPVTAAECLALGGFYLGDGSTCAASECPERPCLIISEVVDGNRAGGNPKFVEITNTDDNDYIFAQGGIIVQSNTSTDRTVDVNLTGVTIPAGTSYVIQSTSNDGQNVFEDTYDATFPGGPIVADVYTPAFFGNGDDRYILTDTDDGSNLLDIYGELDVDGTGTAWEYMNGYAFRNAGANSGNLGTFIIGEWTIGGVDSLSGADDATDKQLLQDNTTPSTHDFAAGCSGGAGGPEDFSLIRCDETGDDSCSDPKMPPNPTFCLVEFPGFPPPVGMPECGDIFGAPFICIECVDATCFASLGSLLEFRVVDGAGPGMDCFFVGNVLTDACIACNFAGTPRFKVVP